MYLHPQVWQLKLLTVHHENGLPKCNLPRRQIISGVLQLDYINISLIRLSFRLIYCSGHLTRCVTGQSIIFGTIAFVWWSSYCFSQVMVESVKQSVQIVSFRASIIDPLNDSEYRIAPERVKFPRTRWQSTKSGESFGTHLKPLLIGLTQSAKMASCGFFNWSFYFAESYRRKFGKVDRRKCCHVNLMHP